MNSVTEKPHAVCIPLPAQSHIKAMLILAKLLHSKGIQITFVNTQYNHNRFIKSGGPDSLSGLPDFRFVAIPDGLPLSDSDKTQDLVTLFKSIRVNCLDPFLALLHIIPLPTCIVSDGFMTFTIDAAEKLGIPVILHWTIAACALMGYYKYQDLWEKGVIPLKDTDGYMDTVIDWIPYMKGIRLKDYPSIKRAIYPNDFIISFAMEATQRCIKASANIIHTFHELEADIVSFLSSTLPQVYTIGPLQLQLKQVPKEDQLNFIGHSLWKEESLCLDWLDSKEPRSVLYVNFGSIAVLSLEKVVEFALGLAKSKQYFLWVIRPDLVMGESAILPSEFLDVIEQRGFTTSWCPQEKVLEHPSVGGFLTHCGWNSKIESLAAGVPMICLPFFGDQPTNCWNICNEWEVGLEIDADFNRDKIEKVVVELMEGDKGKKMKKTALEWKDKSQKATGVNGSSSINLDMLVSNFFTPRSRVEEWKERKGEERKGEEILSFQIIPILGG